VVLPLRGKEVLETIATVIENIPFGAGYCRLRLEVKQPLTVLPGQFAMLKPARIVEPLLRRAMAFYRVETGSQKTIADFIFQVLGRGTEALGQLRPGQEVEFLGPLGLSFSIEAAVRAGGALIVAGGVGSPALLMLCEQLLALSLPTHIFLGARSQSDLIGAEDFARLGLPLYITTDNGSAGEHGFVTQPLERFLNSTAERDFIVYTCGPEPMMKRVVEIAARNGLKSYASLEARMACGFGVCVGCVVETLAPGSSETEYQRVCVEGPVFDGNEVVW
jgi:dihydroorotate dehydrogenase electron transfer subunit